MNLPLQSDKGLLSGAQMPSTNRAALAFFPFFICLNYLLYADLCCAAYAQINGKAGGNSSPLYTPTPVRVIFFLMSTRNSTSPDLPGCWEVLTGIRQNSSGEGGKDEALCLWDSAWALAQSCLVFQYRCHPGKLSCCLHSHALTSTSRPACMLTACSVSSKVGKRHAKNILKTSYSGISRWQESPAFILVGWTTQFPEDWWVHT